MKDYVRKYIKLTRFLRPAPGKRDGAHLMFEGEASVLKLAGRIILKPPLMEMLLKTASHCFESYLIVFSKFTTG